MKKLVIIYALLMFSFAGHAQTFDPDDQSIYYTVQGPAMVRAQFISGSWQQQQNFPMTRFNNVGTVNGLGCNPLDSCLYYINNSGGTCYLYKMDGAGNCTMVSSSLGYTVNGGVDACGNYIQYQTSQIIKTEIATGIVTTFAVPNLGFITDLDYNPFNCNYYNVFFNQGNMLEVDTNGVLLQTITSPEPGTNQVGGMAISPDGTEIYLSRLGSLYSYGIGSGVLSSQTTLTTPAAGAPIADLATFQIDNVIADITNGGADTLYFITCDDSVTVNFANYTTGDVNDLLWDFGDGLTDTLLAPVHTFESNNTYEVVFFAQRFTCETCQIDDTNYDTIYVQILPDTLQTTMAKTDPLCVSSSDGTASVTAAGGTPPYSYLWPASLNTNQNESNLDNGWAVVEVTGSNGCFAIDSVELIDPAPVQINLTLSDALCFNSNDGSAVATPVNPPVTYSYAWSTSGNITDTENGIAAGNHTVTVTDLNNCDTTYTFTINEPSEVVVTPSPDSTICIGGTATLNASAIGGSGGFTYNWTGIGAGSPQVNPAVTTCYEVIAQDVNGCPSQPQQLCVDLHSALTLNVAGGDICPNDDAQLTSAPGGGFGNYNFSWEISGNQIGTTQDITNSQTGTTQYCLTLTDQCETPSVQECITVNVYLEPALSLAPQIICEDETIQFQDPAVNPAEVTSYSWQFGDGNATSGNQPTNTYQYAGSYDVTVDIVSTDNCNFQTVFTDLITVNAIPTPSFTFNPQVVTIENTRVDFFNNSINADTYVWNFGDNSASSSETDPTHIYPDLPGVSYEVTLHAYNGVCHDSITSTVQVQDIVIYYIPNAFTPDGDQYNEEFKPIMTAGIDIYDYHLTIFNRWGEIVFESYNTEYGWNGHYGDGGLVQDGTYIWQLDFAETMSDKRHSNRGHVSVLK